MEIRYPYITVQLTGQDGNAFSILARMTRALHKGGVDPEEMKRFQVEATGGDYSALLATCMRWVNVE